MSDNEYINKLLNYGMSLEELEHYKQSGFTMQEVYESFLNVKRIAKTAAEFGEDNTSFEKFNLSNCIEYVKQTIEYIKITHKHCNIYLFGSSYGGFVLLNGYNEIINNINKIYLMCPAINFCEILENKVGNLNIEYFKNNDFLPLYNNIKIDKKALLEFKNGDNFINNNKFSKVFIIQGDMDKTVLVDNIIDFSNKNNLVYEIIKGGKHELYGYEDNIIEFILNN